MARFHIDERLRKNLEFLCQEKVKKLATEVSEKLTNHYVSLIDWYYSYQPALNKYGEPYYKRTLGLYKSFKKYYKNSHNSIYYGGIEITSNKMHDYPSLNGEGFPANVLLNKFIYNQNGTWHGGDWHGGYGIMADFSIYEEMNNYYKKLLTEYQSRCSVR